MQTISIIEGTSDNFGEKNAKTVSFQTATSRMDFVIKEGNHCSISNSLGNGREMKELTMAFIERHNPTTLVNQVSRDIELKAMHTCGFRLPIEIGLANGVTSMQDILDYFHAQPVSSILLALNGMTKDDYHGTNL